VSTQQSETEIIRDIREDYQYGFSVKEDYFFKSARGLSHELVEAISEHKSEPDWMRKFRHQSLDFFLARPMPGWGADLSGIDFENIYYYIKPTEKQADKWEDLPAEILDTWDRLGIPEAEKKYLAGVGAQYESEVVYHKLQEDLTKQGVLFLDMDSGLREHEDIVKQYFGTIIPQNDNKFAALNSAVWSGGSFIYVPPGVRIEMPLQAYFRINAENMGQFERTLIIVDEGAYVHYVEGCTAPIYSSDSLHSAVVEIIVKKDARCRYTTIQNWSNNVYNLVTKRAVAYEGATMEWVDGNLGCLSGDAQVFTNPSGPRSIAEIEPGDKVYAFDLDELRPVRRTVTGFKERGVQAVYGVETKNHRQIKATANHPFLVLGPATPEGAATLDWKMLYDVHPGHRIGVVRGLPDEGKPRDLSGYAYRGDARGRPRTRLTLPSTTDESLMWLLGAYMGDGYLERNSKGVANRVYFAVPPGDRSRRKLEELLGRVFDVEGRQKGPVALVVASTVLADFLLWLGMAGTARTKRVPGWVWGLPAAQRLAFIEGYLDTDGHTRSRQVRDGAEYGQLTFVSVNRELLEDVKLLAISCGLTPGKISRYVKERKLTLGKEIKEYVSYSLSMNLRENLDAIRSHRAPPMRLEFVPVREIVPLPAEPTYDIEVEGAHNFVANGLLVHNSKVTMKYPAVWLLGEHAHGEVLSIAFAGKGQHQDAGGKVVHIAPRTSSVITSKSISKNGGRAGYRGLLEVAKGAVGSKSKVVCDALILDEESRSDTYPYIQVDENDVELGHEATVSKIGEEQLFYLMSRGLSEAEASAMIVSGFVEPITKELPLEYAVEMNRLIQLQMEGSVG
jgi:Fe-S cluster assembly scaffold protein SufB/intein/homing endonuclease